MLARHLIAAAVLAAAALLSPARPHVRDGMIVFVSDRAGSDAIWAVSAPGGPARQLTHPDQSLGERDSHASFSPDGKHMIFIRENADDTTDLWIANANGSGARRLVSGVLGASFSPNGRQLALIVPSADGTNALALVPAAGGTARTICAGSHGVLGSPAFAPNGKQIAVGDADRGIVVTSLGSCATTVVGIPGADDPSYGPDGTLVWDQPSPEGAGFDIWMKRPALSAHRIVGNGSTNLYPIVAPTGDRLVFSSDETGNGTDVFVTPLTAAHIVALDDAQAACAVGECMGDWDPGWQRRPG